MDHPQVSHSDLKVVTVSSVYSMTYATGDGYIYIESVTIPPDQWENFLAWYAAKGITVYVDGYPERENLYESVGFRQIAAELVPAEIRQYGSNWWRK